MTTCLEFSHPITIKLHIQVRQKNHIWLHDQWYVDKDYAGFNRLSETHNAPTVKEGHLCFGEAGSIHPHKVVVKKPLY